jgi:hypothetical protein
MNRLFTGGLLVLLLGVAVGTLAVVRAANTIEACGFPLVIWLGSAEAQRDPGVAAMCPSERGQRRSEVLVEGALAGLLVIAGTTLTILGWREDKRYVSALPPDPFDRAESSP